MKRYITAFFKALVYTYRDYLIALRDFCKKHKKTILIVCMIIILSMFAYETAHEIATHQRGYEAIGGELCLLFYPLVLLALRDAIKGCADEIKSCKQCAEYKTCTFKAPDGKAICNEFRKGDQNGKA